MMSMLFAPVDSPVLQGSSGTPRRHNSVIKVVSSNILQHRGISEVWTHGEDRDTPVLLSQSYWSLIKKNHSGYFKSKVFILRYEIQAQFQSYKMSDMELLNLHGGCHWCHCSVRHHRFGFRKWTSAALDYWFFAEKSAVVQNLCTSRRKFCVKLVHFAQGCILNSSCSVCV